LIKILNAEPSNYSLEARRILRSIGELHESRLKRDDLLKCLKDFDVLIVRLGIQVDRDLISSSQRLKAIVTAATGLDHIDTEAASKRGVAVLSLKGESEFLRCIHATAEHTWALVLALTRNIPAAAASVKRGEWNRDLFRGTELFSKILGIVGYGRIGEKVGAYGQAFGMQPLAYDPGKVDFPLPVKKCDSLKDLLEAADVISLHVPLNENTKTLMSDAEFEMMKRGAVLINTSRGGVVDEDALLEALETERLGGAALDVVENESTFPSGKTRLLVEYAKVHTNLIITPHIGGATVESMEKTEIFMANKLKTFLSDLANSAGEPKHASLSKD
jgi:D-3-phosphoglycerate dehydrogenase